jgi:uncharacterized protein YkwD
MKKLISILLALCMIFCFNVYADEPVALKSSFAKGDVNGDGSVDAADLALLKKVVANLTPADSTEVKNPNVDGIGTVPDAADLALLKKIVANLIPNEPSLVTKEQLRQIEEGFLTLVNYERTRVGVNQLKINADLDYVAQIRSVEIIDTWSHTRPNGKPFYSLVDETSYSYITCGENICMTSHVGNGYFTDKDKWIGSAAQIEAAYSWIFYLFKNSPGHYQNMINSSYADCGIGISYTEYADGLPMFYVSHIFGNK